MHEIYNKSKPEPGYTKKFSSFFKRIVLEFPGGDQIKWEKSHQRETDGVEIKRAGTVETLIKIKLYRDCSPVKWKLSPHLSAFLGTHEESLENILTGIWEYIKKYSL